MSLKMQISLCNHATSDNRQMQKEVYNNIQFLK